MSVYFTYLLAPVTRTKVLSWSSEELMVAARSCGVWSTEIGVQLVRRINWFLAAARSWIDTRDYHVPRSRP